MLTVRQAREAGARVTIYCDGPARCPGRILDMARLVGTRWDSWAFATLQQGDVLRCKTCGHTRPLVFVEAFVDGEGNGVVETWPFGTPTAGPARALIDAWRAAAQLAAAPLPNKKDPGG